MNLTKITRKEPLPSGFFVVSGEQGVGKTSFCTALLYSDYKKWSKWRTEEGKALANEYYQDNKIKLSVSDRLYFSSVKILLNKRKRLYTHYVDVQRLGLPNPDFKVQYLPRGSVVYIQEADILLFCRDFQELNAYLINLLKYVRHNLLTIIFDCQAFGALDKAVRRLAVGIYYMEKSYDSRFFIFWKQRKWKFYYIRNQLNEVVKELATVGIKIKVNVVERGRFRALGNVFERYNSFSGVRYFLHGIEKVGYEYRDYPSETYTVEDINEFVTAHPLVRPEDMKKKKGKNQKTDEQLYKNEKPRAYPLIEPSVKKPSGKATGSPSTGRF